MIVAPAGRAFQIEATSDLALAAITPAFSHLTNAPHSGDATIRWTISEEDDGWRPRAFGATGAYRLPDGGFAVVQDDPPHLEAYRPGLGIELRAGPASLGGGDFRAHPASFALAAALSGPGCQVLHAGAVAFDGIAALLVGIAGVGKSTTTLACALAGADFLGDDLILVEAGEGGQTAPVAHSLFTTAKLNADSAAALGAGSWPAIGVTPRGKAVVVVSARMSVVRSARIGALIFLAPPSAGGPQPHILRPAEALSLFMPTASPVACRTGAPGDWLALVAALARRLPAYRLPVTWQLDALVPAVRAIVSRVADPTMADRRRVAG